MHEEIWFEDFWLSWWDEELDDEEVIEGSDNHGSGSLHERDRSV